MNLQKIIDQINIMLRKRTNIFLKEEDFIIFDIRNINEFSYQNVAGDVITEGSTRIEKRSELIDKMRLELTALINEENDIRSDSVVDGFKKKIIIRIVHEIVPNFVYRLFGLNKLRFAYGGDPVVFIHISHLRREDRNKDRRQKYVNKHRHYHNLNQQT